VQNPPGAVTTQVLLPPSAVTTQVLLPPNALTTTIHYSYWIIATRLVFFLLASDDMHGPRYLCINKQMTNFSGKCHTDMQSHAGLA